MCGIAGFLERDAGRVPDRDALVRTRAGALELDAPRRRLKQLDKRYRTKYHMSMLDNLAAIKTDGIRAFVQSERERWSCKTCGGTVDVHHYRCSVCGKQPV